MASDTWRRSRLGIDQKVNQEDSISPAIAAGSHQKLVFSAFYALLFLIILFCTVLMSIDGRVVSEQLSPLVLPATALWPISRLSSQCSAHDSQSHSTFYWNETCVQWPRVEQNWYVGSKYQLEVESKHITAYSAATPDRLDLLQRGVTHWQGPYILALYVHESDDLSSIRSFFDTHNFTRVLIHLVFAVNDDPLYPFPINFCRNVALLSASTTHVLSIDADFRIFPLDLPSRQFPLSRDIFILPSFETNNSIFDASKKEFLRGNDIFPSGQGSWRKNPYLKGHFDADYDQFLSANTSESYCVYGKCPCSQYFFNFEPYFIIPTLYSPLWPEILPFGIREKVGHRLRVEGAGFGVAVESDAYVVHYPHSRYKRGDQQKKYHLSPASAFDKIKRGFITEGSAFGKLLDSYGVKSTMNCPIGYSCSKSTHRELCS